MYFEEVSESDVKEHQKLARDRGVRESRQDRWKNTVKRVHVILPNKIHKTQAYIAKNGVGIHGSLLLRDIFEIIFRLECFPPIIFYWNHQNYSNEFIKVFNNIPDDVIEPSWKSVRKLAFMNVRERDDGTFESTKKDDSREQRATIGLDGGVASTVAAKRGNNKSKDGKLNHHSMPPIKECTPLMRKLFMPATSLMQSSDSRGIWLNNDTSYYTFQEHPSYQSEFAGKCCSNPSNIVPSLRVSAQNPKNPLYAHFDTTNGKYPETETIGGMNRCALDFQIRTNWSAKQAQENYVIRTLQDRAMTCINNIYQQLPTIRRHITSSLSQGTTETYLPGFQFIAKRCHTKTDSFYALYLHHTLCLYRHFSLTVPETISVMMCVMLMPNSAVFFAIASKILIRSYDKHEKPASGFNFGYLLDGVQKEAIKHFLKTDTQYRSTHWERFKDQRPKEVKIKQLKQENWKFACYGFLKIVMRSNSHFNEEPPSGVTVYMGTMRAIGGLIKGAGSLTATHVVRIAAHIGILPNWMAGMAKLEKHSKTVKWIVKKWPEYADQVQSEPQIFLESLTYFLQQENPGDGINLATAENIGCKSKRIDTGGDGKYWDIFDEEQDVYDFLQGTIRVHSREKIEDVPSNKLISRWVFGNAELLTMAQISKKSEVPVKMCDAIKYAIPIKFWRELNDVTYPDDFDAHGMTVPKPTRPTLPPSAVQIGSKLLQRTLRKYKIK